MTSPKRVDSWIVTDDFWQRVEPLIPARQRVAGKTYLRQPGAGRPPKPAAAGVRGYFLCPAHGLPVEGAAH